MASLKPCCRLTAFDSKNNADKITVTPDLRSGHVLVTSSNRHVTVWDVKSHKLSSSWTLRSGQAVSGGAVTDTGEDKYVAVLNNQNLHSWGPGDKTVEKSKKIKLSQPVHCLHSAADYGVVIIYSNGCVALCHDPSTTYGEAADNDISHAAVQLHQGHLVVAVWYSSHIQIVSWHGQDVPPVCTRIKINDSKRAIGHCLHEKQGQLHCLHLDSGGGLTQVCITGPLSGDCSRLHQVPDLQSNISITSLGENYLVIGGICIAGQGGVGIWDTKFGLLQAWQPFPEGVTSSSQVLTLDSELLLACPTGIYLYPYIDQPSTLGAALGKFAGCAEQDHIPPSLSQLLNDLISTTKTPSKKSFCAKFKSFIKHSELEGENLLLIQPLLGQLLRRCLNTTEFWPSEELGQLIDAKLIPQSIQGALFGALTERKEFSLLHKCLIKLSDIPEACLVAVLACFLSAEEDVLLGHFDKEMMDGEEVAPGEEVKCPFRAEKAAFVNSVLVKPYNDVFMLECLRNLNIDQSLLLLDYLQYLVYQVPLSIGDKGPSLLKVVDWLNLMLDAHFSQLVLTAEARKSLITLHQAVESQVELYDELVSLEAVLNQLKARCVVPQKQSPGLYNIHVLHV